MKDVQSGGLLLLSVKVHERETRVESLERFEDEPNLLARGDEHDTFHLQVRLDEPPESVEFAFEADDGVELLEVGRDDAFFSWLVAVDVQRIVEGELGQSRQV